MEGGMNTERSREFETDSTGIDDRLYFKKGTNMARR